MFLCVFVTPVLSWTIIIFRRGAFPLISDTTGQNIAESLVSEGLATVRREGIRGNMYGFFIHLPLLSLFHIMMTRTRSVFGTLPISLLFSLRSHCATNHCAPVVCDSAVCLLSSAAFRGTVCGRYKQKSPTEVEPSAPDGGTIALLYPAAARPP